MRAMAVWAARNLLGNRLQDAVIPVSVRQARATEGEQRDRPDGGFEMYGKADRKAG